MAFVRFSVYLLKNKGIDDEEKAECVGNILLRLFDKSDRKEKEQSATCETFILIAESLSTPHETLSELVGRVETLREMPDRCAGNVSC